MRPMPRSLVVVALLASSLTAVGSSGPAWAASQPRYTITELGPLPGGDSSFATAINDAGVVVGGSRDSSYRSRAVKWTNGVPRDLGVLPGGGSSQANAINDAGQVAGYATRTDGGYAYPARWSASGVIQDLGGPITNRLGAAYGIDPGGRVVGGQRPADSEGAWVGTWYDTAGTMSELGSPPDSLGPAYGINNKDQIVGTAPAYLWQKGNVTVLPVLPGAQPSTAGALAINISGQIVGAAEVPGIFGHHAVLWQGGTITDLGTVDGILNSTAHAINAAAQVVGNSDPGCSPCGPTEAWIWQPGTAMTRLDTLIPAGSGWTLTEANGINDAGQIVGSGTHNGHERAFLLTPTFHANVNFQTTGGRIPTGYLADTGNVYGPKAGGLSYGWNADNTAWTRDRNDTVSADQRYETLIHLQKPGSASTWELAVPNGTYSVHLVAGDACCTDSVFRLDVEGTLALSGTPTATTHWFEKTVRVTVTDGRLTITNAPGSSNNKLNYVDVVAY